MYCSQCGKKVMDTMLFCPFCGSPIVIPDQEDEIRIPELSGAIVLPEMEQKNDPVSEPVPDENADESEDSAKEIGLEEFVPLIVEQAESVKKTDEEKDVSDEIGEDQPSQEPVRLHGLKPDLSPVRQFGAPKIASQRKNTDTLVPQRKFDPEDIFMDAAAEEDGDYDDYDYDYEERDESSFWVRHIRGLVALLLLLAVAAVLIGWSFSNSGQQALARADLAWRPSAYAEIAYDAYQKGYYSQSGNYYSRAVAHDTSNYDYASSAGVAYYMAQDMVNAEAMARLAIQIDPAKISAYDILLRIYPDVALRPMEIQRLLQTGYELTGDSRLISA